MRPVLDMKEASAVLCLDTVEATLATVEWAVKRLGACVLQYSPGMTSIPCHWEQRLMRTRQNWRYLQMVDVEKEPALLVLDPHRATAVLSMASAGATEITVSQDGDVKVHTGLALATL